MKEALILQLALSAFRLAAARTKTTVDDQIVVAADQVITILLSRPQFDVWAVANMLLGVAKFYAERTARTGDDKLTAEFQAVVTALEGVVGSEVFRTQLRDRLVDWPFLSAPGVPA